MGWCINGDCMELKDVLQDEMNAEARHDRYALILTKGSLIIRRADIMKELTDAGGKLSEY